MTDPVKQREMEIKVSQSQQKIMEWEEELKQLKGLYILIMHFPNLLSPLLLVPISFLKDEMFFSQ